MKKLSIVFSFLVAPVLITTVPLHGQTGGLDPADILKPLANQWTSYSGDFTGKRFRAQTQINLNTVKNLTRKRINPTSTTGCGPDGPGAATGAAAVGGGGRGSGRGGGGGAASTLIL